MSQNNENYSQNHKPSGEISMILHKGGEYNPKTGKIEGAKEIIDEKKVKNLIVNTASKLMAYRMAPMQLSEMGNTVDELQNIMGLQVLAVGVGILMDPTKPYDKVTNPVNTSQWDYMNPPAESLNDTQLVGEIFRKPFTSWAFVNENDEPQNVNTNILKLVTTFMETEAPAPITEMGIFGGNAQDFNDGAGIGTGFLFNRKTFPVWNKDSSSRLTITWRLTF